MLIFPTASGSPSASGGQRREENAPELWFKCPRRCQAAKKTCVHTYNGNGCTLTSCGPESWHPCRGCWSCWSGRGATCRSSGRRPAVGLPALSGLLVVYAGPRAGCGGASSGRGVCARGAAVSPVHHRRIPARPVGGRPRVPPETAGPPGERGAAPAGRGRCWRSGGTVGQQCRSCHGLPHGRCGCGRRGGRGGRADTALPCAGYILRVPTLPHHLQVRRHEQRAAAAAPAAGVGAGVGKTERPLPCCPRTPHSTLAPRKNRGVV